MPELEMDLQTLRDIDRQIADLRLSTEQKFSSLHMNVRLFQQESLSLRQQIIDRLDKIETKINAPLPPTPRPPWVVDLSGLPWVKLILVSAVLLTQLPTQDLANIARFVSALSSGSTAR